MIKIKFKIINYLFIFAVFFVFASQCFASEIFFKNNITKIGINKEFETKVFVSIDSKSLNAIEGEIIFPNELLEIKEINYGNSIINFWVEKPKMSSSGELSFSGIIPGGYSDKQGFVLSIIFIAKKEGYGQIRFDSIKALQNDGEGTELKITKNPLSFSIFKNSLNSNNPSLEKMEDKNAPEEFLIEISSSTDIFNGKYFLVFTAQDKESGINHYEIQEHNSNFIIGESPYLLINQKLDKPVNVKAVDNRGNERIMTLPAQKVRAWYVNYFILAIIVIVLFVFIILNKKLWPKFIKSY